MRLHPKLDAVHDNPRSAGLILGLAILSAILYVALSLAGDMRDQLPAYYAIHAALLILMLAAWSRLRRSGRAGRGVVLCAALVFRLIAATSQPNLSDDVYRYVWDGRVQLHGHHPYRHAPTDPALEALRDEHWSRINHPELKTIYPPLSQMLFVGLAALGAGPLGFKLALGMIDFAAVLVLGLLLRKLELPRDRLVLYAWNPLAVVETAGSGHVEPLAVALMLLGAAWIINRRRELSTLALAGAVQAKLLPAVLLPGHLRRTGWKGALLLALAVTALFLPYAFGGPLVGPGLYEYAGRWERNALIFPAVRGALETLRVGEMLKPWLVALQQLLGDAWLPWDLLYRHAWPPGIARLIVTGAALLWIAHVVLRRRAGPARESFLVLGGVLLLAPTLHPWYLLWVLPWAAAFLSWPWLVFAMLVPLSYWSVEGDVPWALRLVEYLPFAALGLALWLLRRRRRSAVPCAA